MTRATTRKFNVVRYSVSMIIRLCMYFLRYLGFYLGKRSRVPSPHTKPRTVLTFSPCPLPPVPSPCCCSGHLPKRLAFWAVANPMVEADEEGVERVRKKVELGAEVIVTQPPLVWEFFER